MAIKSVVRIYRRERFLRLSADIKWTGYSSIEKKREDLFDLVCSDKSTFKQVFEEAILLHSDRVEMCIKGGKKVARSFFVFFKCSRKKSRIIGACSTNKLFDLIEDFDFLREQMSKSNMNFALSEPKVYLDNNEVFDTIDKRGLSIKSVLPEFLGTAGFFSGAISYLVFGEFNQITVVAFILGLISWMGSLVYGNWNRPKYVFIEQE
jgi:hypothetical protein